MMGVMAERLLAQLDTAAPAEDFRQWVLREQRRVFALCYRVLQERDEADAAAQDSFLKAYRSLGSITAMAPEERSRWITRVAINTCLDRLRSRGWKFWRQRPEPEDERLILSSVASREPNAEDQVFARQIARRLAVAMAGLSARQRAVFALRHYEDRPLEEIAAILALDVGTVKAHLSRALSKLREELKDFYGFRREPAGR